MEDVDELPEAMRCDNIEQIHKAGYNDTLKCPQLIVLVIELRKMGIDYFARVKDPSGEIEATVHHKTAEKFEALEVGVVLSLRNVSILSLPDDDYYLNIVPRNIESMFS